MKTSIELDALTVRHGADTLVATMSLGFRPGEAVTILGESGSGKSLLAHAIMGTLPPELEMAGQLSCAGRHYDLADRHSRRPLWGRELAILPQEPVLSLDPTMRTLAQVAEGAPSFRRDKRGALAAAGQLLSRLGLGKAEAAYPFMLSGGMAQRVAFAATTIAGARFLIADEPSKGLDERARDELVTLLRQHLADGGLLLTITHDVEVARQLAGQVLVMKEGDVVEQGAAAQLLTAPAHDYTRRLLAAEPEAWPDRLHPSPGEVLVEAGAIGKAYRDKTLFADLDLRIHAAERMALLAPSGSGKTTLGNVLLGLAPVDRGRLHHASGLQGRMQKLYQDPVAAFAPRLTLAAAFADILKRHGLDRRELTRYLDALRLDGALLARLPSQVSGGELQRLALIRALLLKPRLIFADEPTSRLDPITQQETMQCLLDQVSEEGCALLLVTHDETIARKTTSQTIRLGAAVLPSVTPAYA